MFSLAVILINTEEQYCLARLSYNSSFSIVKTCHILFSTLVLRNTVCPFTSHIFSQISRKKFLYMVKLASFSTAPDL